MKDVVAEGMNGGRGGGNGARGEVIAGPTPQLCMDFANTLAWRGSATAESLHNIKELIDWAASTGCLTTRQAAAALAWARKSPAPAGLMLAQALGLREALYATFARLARGGEPSRDAIAQLNRALDEAPARRVLAAERSRIGWRIERDLTSVAELLAPVLWSAADVLAGRQTARLRLCANPKCLWLFVDDSKSGTRRWCSMQACGNRAKAHSHYLRKKSE
ncbi:MAG TPA: ABATE domain-containing protein [Candidatus Binataceae bacterium]|nr:ABATE domain-containing protein [Candidatus Binataceae bacterium]